MEITHRDRNGQYWRFNIDCTAEQGEKIRQTLAGVRNMGRARALSISALMEEQAAGRIFADVETAILRGLADAFPYRETPEPQGLRNRPEPTPPQPQPVQVTPADDTAPRYWWERD